MTAGLKLYTVFCHWGHPPYDVEEVDVEARDREEAPLKAMEVLGSDYEPGWKIADVVEREPQVRVQSWKGGDQHEA